MLLSVFAAAGKILPETFFSVAEQTELFLMSVVLGAAFGVLFDVFRSLRVIIPMLRGSIATAVCDIIFFLMTGVGIYLFSVLFARGEVRGYYWVGAFLGGIIYLCTAGSFIMMIFRGFFGWLYMCIHKVYLLINKQLVNKFRKYLTKIKTKFVLNAKKQKNT